MVIADMTDDGNSLESDVSTPKANQEIKVKDFTTNKCFQIKLSFDALETLLREGKVERETDDSFKAEESVLREIEKQSLIEELQALDVNESLSCTASYQEGVRIKRRRGRPRKNTLLPSPHSGPPRMQTYYNMQNTKSKRKSKRKKDEALLDDSTDADYYSEIDQMSLRTKSKRMRQPKVLDDFVTDFESTDEESKLFSFDSPAFHMVKQKRGRGRSQPSLSTKNMESNDILSVCMGYIDKKFSDPELDKNFLDEFQESDEEESDIGVAEGNLSGGSHVSNREDVTPSASRERRNKKVKLKLDEHSKDKPASKQRGRKRSKRPQLPEMAALQDQYIRLLNMLQKSPHCNKVVDLVHGASKFLTEEQLVFFTLQLKAGLNKNLQGVRFSAHEKVLALAIYAHSPETYKWMQSIFHLPTKLILDRWLESIAKTSPDTAKKLMYFIYNKYIFKS
ncbi:hypothetical protein SK128_022161 [Halocaridina rubra]|uniref:Uncharacterized protein n=1 Tax=Halocaridina rubra TaxID=373956 RepID=A0AAN8X5J9_HALRR